MMASSLSPESPVPFFTVKDSVQPESVWLHAEDCTESPEDLQRMRDLIKEDPSLLYKIQPVPHRTTSHSGLGYVALDSQLGRPSLPPPPQFGSPPLWHACRVQHLTCVQSLLQASPPESITSLLNFRYPEKNILSYSYFHARKNKQPEKSYEIIKTLLEHGMPPSVAIPLAEIHNPEILQVLQQYQTKTVFFPSSIAHMAAEKGDTKILKLLLYHGVHPDPVILTESGSVLPLYPTLAGHLNPIPAIDFPGIKCDSLLHSLSEICEKLSFEDLFQSIKILLVHGASLPPYSVTDENPRHIISQVTFIFRIIFKFDLIRYPDLDGFHADWTPRRQYDVTLETLKLYRQFGGSFRWKMKRLTPCEGGKGECLEALRDANVSPCNTIPQFIRIIVKEEPEQSMLVEEVQRMMGTPLSLQQAARLVIRRSMGYGYVRNLEALPLPDRLKNYLKFECETE